MFTASQWTARKHIELCRGPQGPTGPTGPSGPIGASGIQGPSSSTSGPSGAIGPSGGRGPSGSTGVGGPTGPEPGTIGQISITRFPFISGGSNLSIYRAYANKTLIITPTESMQIQIVAIPLLGTNPLVVFLKNPTIHTLTVSPTVVTPIFTSPLTLTRYPTTLPLQIPGSDIGPAGTSRVRRPGDIMILYWNGFSFELY